MGWILRTKDDLANPTLAGGVYGKYITRGMPVYYRYDGSQTRGILLISDGGKYGMDSVDSFEYKGAALTVDTEWIFHRGTLPLQIVPFDVTALDIGSNTFTAPGHPFIADTPLRVGVIDGDVPEPLSKSTIYYAHHVSGDDFRISTSTGGSGEPDITTAGTGQVIVWEAVTGFDDPDQGLPTFCPEVETCFSNISYIEFKLPTNRSSATEQPDWEDFRIIGTGRRLMDYDVDGTELGVTADPVLLSNVALEIADNAFVGYEVKPERFDWASWFALKESADTDIWQRLVESNDPAAPSGFTGRYYNNEDFTSLIVTRNDTTIDMGGEFTDAPAPGVQGDTFSVRWTGRITPLYSETYTFTLIHDDTIKVWIDGALLLDEATYGTHTFTFAMVADQLYDIQIELTQGETVSFTNLWECRFKWQSASQALQVVPATAVIPTDEIVKRYECHIAFPSATECSEVHEQLMDRVPGWDWTDDQGLIKFLGPDRPIVFAFEFDKLDDDSTANFEKNTFVKKRRSLADRKNFRLYRFRDVLKTGYPFQFVQADREALRAFTNGEPSNDPARDLGVGTRSLAERTGEMDMVLNTDADHVVNLSGGRASSKIRKSQFVSLSYYDADGNYVADAKYIVTMHSWGARNEKSDFILWPVPDVFYTDEPVVV